MGCDAYSDITGASSANSSYASIAAKQERQRQRNITTGTANINQAYSGFNPQFYQQRAQDYINYAQPQLAQQYRTNQADMGFGLANRGLLGSSVAAKKGSLLNRTEAQAQRNVVDAGTAQAQALQNQIEGSRTNLLGQLYQSADPAGAGKQAIGTAASFSAPSIFQPLADQFGSIAQSYYLASLLNQGQGQAQPVGFYPSNNSGIGAGPNTPTSYGSNG